MGAVDAYLARMEACARAMGRVLAPIEARERLLRLAESDAALVETGFASGLLRIEPPNRVRTADPFQGTAWLVEGDPARLCWEYVPHLAGYVELVTVVGYPVAAVRFETPDAELNLDLVVLDADGRALVVGEVKREDRQLRDLERLLPRFDGDPGKAPPRSAEGAPGGPRREAWKLAHQLWRTRAPYLWLVASGVRRVYDVEYAQRLRLRPRPVLPAAADLWTAGVPESPVRLAPGVDASG